MFESGKRNLKRVGRKEDFLRGEGSARHAEKVEFFPESKSESASPRRKTFQLYSLDHVQRRLAIVDDDEGILAYLEDILSQSGFQVQCFKNAESFLMKLEASVDSKQGLVDVILCDVRLPGKDGHTLLGDLKEKSPDIPLILMTAFAEVEMVVQAIRDGAFDYLEKPFDSTRLVSILENALRFRRLSYENKFLKNIVDPDIQLQGVQCQSPSMKAVYDLIKRVAPTDSSVLITGESGVGKEIVARAIHDNSSRSEKPFISINCSAIPESLLESELFGHTRGSFTGATHHRKGLFEEADGGTLFLDEIGDLKFSLQAKLLRVFQEKRIRAIGDNDFRVVDVRILTATHKDLPEEIRANRFREDLYYRLNVIPIHIPPLRQRREDILLLGKYFLESSVKKNNLEAKGLSPAALNKLISMPWHGNVRELKNVIERSAILSTGDQIEDADIPVNDQYDSDELIEEISSDLPSLKMMERRYILSVLKRHQGRKEMAAKVLGLSRRTLYRKLMDLGEGQDIIF